MVEFKIVIFGIGGVGKSALTIQFIRHQFMEEYDPTIEDSYRKTIELEGERIDLDILDTAGQEEYSSMRDQYIRNGDGFLVVYSIDDLNSFYEAEKIIHQIKLIYNNNDNNQLNEPIILIGNKSDLDNLINNDEMNLLKRQVTIQEATQIAQKWRVPFIETSAKLNINVEQAFILLVKWMRTMRFGLGQLPTNNNQQYYYQLNNNNLNNNINLNNNSNSITNNLNLEREERRQRLTQAINEEDINLKGCCLII